jgi:threonine dehydrogenase-like Zn-dependent dehydrogenase
MRAVSCADGVLSVVEVDDPVPGHGQLVLDVLRTGICGSDLHAREHADDLADVLSEVAYDDFMRRDRPTVMGHEFVGTVRERRRGGPRELREGILAVAMPIRRAAGGTHLTGLSPYAPGGYAEQVLVEQPLTFAVPNGLAPETAALTEPMAVGLHAVNQSGVSRRDTAVVLGCGPVGLAVIAWLKARKVRHVVAADLSPGRRELARRMGADVVVDPTVDSPYDGGRFMTEVPKLLDLAVGSMRPLRVVPGWQHVFRAADRLGATVPSGPVVFECVGVPGMIESVVTAAPLHSRIVVVGVCMGPDSFRPSMAINKEVELRFVIYYTPLEFRDALHALADGTVDASPLVTGTVGLDGVATAFDALRDPERHAKILIDPTSTAVAP